MQNINLYFDIEIKFDGKYRKSDNNDNLFIHIMYLLRICVCLYENVIGTNYKKLAYCKLIAFIVD